MKMILLSTFLCFAVVACGGARSYDPVTVATINVGDSKSDVVTKLGDPHSETKLEKKTDNGCSQMMTYAYTGGPTGAAAVIVLLDDSNKVCVKPGASDGTKK